MYSDIKFASKTEKEKPARKFELECHLTVVVSFLFALHLLAFRNTVYRWPPVYSGFS